MYDIVEPIQLEETRWTPISGLTVESRAVNVRFSVVKKGVSRQVTSKTTGRFHLICDCVVGDETGIIALTLWNDDIDDIQLGLTYELRNGQITMFDECMSLSKGRWGKIRVASPEVTQVDRTTDMSRPFMGRPKRRRHTRSPTGRTFQGTPGRESKGYCSRKGF